MTQTIQEIAKALVTKGKGILAADESNATITKRFNAINIESTPESRRDYRHMLFSNQEAISNYISGVILYDETIRQTTEDLSPLTKLLTDQGCFIGIKVDTGAKDLANFPNETITEGLDGLRERLNEYYKLGARFAKWRAVIHINTEANLPSDGSIIQNANALARYAALCQEANIVPIVEPEVMMDGTPANHNIETCYQVTKKVLLTVFAALNIAKVKLDAMILKPNMIIDGQNARKATIEQVAEYTIKCLKETVPPALAGIAFLSGGQTDDEATKHLAAINNIDQPKPWPLTFSYGRALQAAALNTWAGKKENIAKAQAIFTQKAKANSLATLGK
ncbi:class I fructose-bisphosphate aldolase [Bartonella sp. DGB1]|uniref:class I fructose-bisphosphate aldolase n=1 Tax=Bartonella sp. DGB1 TaxID=3239807 RepID=UPI0035236DB5